MRTDVITVLRNILLLIIVNSLTIINLTSQDDEDFYEKEIITFGIGTELNSFFGDYNPENNIPTFATTNSSFFFNLEKRFGNTIALQLNLLKGSVADNDISLSNTRNFKTDIINIGANFILHLDNDIIISKKNPFSPYILFGFNYINFKSYSDYYDANDEYYYYWDDGTIRNISQNDTNNIASFLYRDYKYETLIEDSNLINNSNTVINLPFTLGFKFKINSQFQVRIFGTYNLLLSDIIDNVIDNNNNDFYSSMGLSVNYTINKIDKELKQKYNDFNISDEDGDGVYDNIDFCHHTQSGISVDLKGCPLDSDNDGVPHYIDKEPNTKSSAVVDELGRELTDSLFQMRSFEKDSMEIEKIVVFSKNPRELYFEEHNQETLKTNDNFNVLIGEIDSNNNKHISYDELNSAIELFSNGSLNCSQEEIYELIDYFFDQPVNQK